MSELPPTFWLVLVGLFLQIGATIVGIAFFAARVKHAQEMSAALLSKDVQGLTDKHADLKVNVEARLGKLENGIEVVQQELAIIRGSPLPRKE